jgi:group I intron endonuclease
MANPMMNAHIYLVTNALNGKQYVGQTTVAKNKIGHGYAMTDAYKKHGKDVFTYEKICGDIHNRQTLNFIERFWIKVMDCRAPNGYNIEEGGSTKGEVAESTRKKLSASNKGKVISAETRKKISQATVGAKNHFYGKKHNQEAREKISAAGIGRVVVITDEQKKKISLANGGEKNGMYGKKHTEETKAKFKNRSVNRPWLGKKFSEEHKAHLSMTRTCPHCQKVGKGNAMIRYHMDNCKVKE